MERYDVVVVGLGIMGAAATWRANLLGASVFAIEQGGPTHRSGSSHGATRIFRQAYWEGRSYLDLLSLADKGWRELQHVTGSRLIVETGGIFVGPRSTGVVAGSRETARHGGIDHEHLTAADVRGRFPQFTLDGDMEAVFEPGAYAVLAEDAKLQMLNEATRDGVQVSYGNAVRSLTGEAGQIVVHLRSGRCLIAGSVIVCAGAANSSLIPELTSILRPRRVPIYWFEPRAGREGLFTGRAFPVFLYETNDGALLYGVPAGISAENGVKIGFHNRQHVSYESDAIQMPRIESYAHEIEGYVARIFPDLAPKTLNGIWCTYTMSPDQSFIIDRSVSNSNIIYASVCSGHGFKFAPAIGQVLAEQAIGRPPSVDLAAFGINRFGSAPAVGDRGEPGLGRAGRD